MVELSNANAALYFVDRQSASSVAEKTVFQEVDGQKRRITYYELAQESGRLAALYHRHGVRREERAVLLVLDQIEFPVIFWGSLKAGVVPVAVNTLLGTDTYAAILRDSRARVLFVSHQLFPVIAPALEANPHCEVVFVIGEDKCDPAHLNRGVGINVFDFAAELEDCAPQEPVHVTADECAFWLYSSGSTGQPKGVRHVHGSMGYTAETYGSKVLGIRSDDIVYSAAKFFFAYGLGNAMTFPMAVGATTLLLSGRPTPDTVVEIVNTCKPTIFCGVPTLYAAMIAYLEAGKGHLKAPLRRCISAGEALPAEIGRSWQTLCGTEILDGVGSTEMLHIFLSNRPGEVVYGTSGVAVPGYEIKLVDENGEPVGIGEIGELLVSGDSSAQDYWNQRDKSRATFEGRWTRTGDKYEMADSGRLIYCGRTDDMFKVSGIWVSPFEVEQALASHPAVLEAAVVPARDANGLEKPKAFVVLKNPASSVPVVPLLQEHVKQQIGRWKYPRWIEIASELPKTATGKIQRFKLRS